MSTGKFFRLRPLMLATASIFALAACETNFDHIGPGLKRKPVETTAPRPKADVNGVISYPSYQVVEASQGDTVSDIALRVGIEPSALARHNGLDPEHVLHRGEILALPQRVEAGAVRTGFDITTIASNAIDRADDTDGSTAPNQSGIEPIRHRVERGETVYSISRLYGVSVTALADWNGLGSDLTVRDGQFLLIPVVRSAGASGDVSQPGQGSTTPVPPSASQPLPRNVTPAKVPDSPNLQQFDNANSTTYQMPVTGKIIKSFSKKSGGNDGIDIAASAGSTVVAAQKGTVALVSKSVGQSTIVLVRHTGNIISVYSNIVSPSVTKGQSVKRGQPLGKIAEGTPSFLHFEIRRGTESIDPMPFFK
jgi:lipoprotein NlpD